MSSQWPNLKSPPVIMAIFQLKYHKEGVDLNDFIQYDEIIKREYPNRHDNYLANIDMPKTFAPGISTITGKADTKITSYIYFSKDQKQKLMIEEGSITYTNENKYAGWEDFTTKALKTLDMLQELLNQRTIKRISIRFINKFSFESFNDPLEYFTTTISSNQANGLAYPLSDYAFKLKVTVPDTNIYAYINQAINPVNNNQIDYIFDIDVLDLTNLIFDLTLISESLKELRKVKNTLFFDNLTKKTIDLCN
jgi:uncharacterized protein (TIGR04255 family)